MKCSGLTCGRQTDIVRQNKNDVNITMGLFIRWNYCEEPDCMSNGGSGGLVAWCSDDTNTPKDFYEVYNENDYKNCVNIKDRCSIYKCPFRPQGNGVTGFVVRPVIDNLPKIRYFVSKSMCKKGLKVQIKTCEDPKDCFCFDCQI